ncbi:stage III sporulation protein SpoIIIAB [Ferviditalea candida]|uniref:Stage III sporulation protein SpoIIIAB n=1 Tax=Ferviditalea candida TaxID=3108399 RepID=A0ABU5ZJF4_9BACL|nr:stage III sporulation protein SpoIIIAB [Paenibacillaceae bacterium T2]
MLKLMGAALVLFAGAMAGFYQSWRLASRPRQIRGLIHALQVLETEIVYALTPLPEALRKLGRKTAAPVSGLFGQIGDRLEQEQGITLQEVWEFTALDYWKQTAMKETEREIVRQLGRTLGISDREDQVKHLHLAIRELQREEMTAIDEQKRYEKMWKSLGILAGVLIVIMMY